MTDASTLTDIPASLAIFPGIVSRATVQNFVVKVQIAS